MIWVILLARYNIIWLGFMSVVIFVLYCIYFYIFKLPSARPVFWWGNSLTGPRMV